MTSKEATMEPGLSFAADGRLLLAASYPSGGPLHWLTELGQSIANAMMDFIDYGAGLAPEPSDDALRLVRAYFEYYINAPSWGAPTTELITLRERIRAVRTIEHLNTWVEACRQIGLDPL